MRTRGAREQLRIRLLVAAEREVNDLVRSLPGPVRKFAEALPVHYEMTPRPFELESGLDPDLLGLFTGASYAEETSSTAVEPSQIILFLENIWDFADRDSATFLEEVRRTYMHELGHYLGLDEDDLASRDLD